MMKAAIADPGAVLRVSGEDHQSFLQSQGTADLRGAPGFCRYSLWLNHKGLIEGDAFVLKISEGHVLLVSHRTPAESLAEKFGRHIIADDVEIRDETADWQLLSIPPGEGADPAFAGDGLKEEADHLIFPGRLFGEGTVHVLARREAALMKDVEPIPETTVEAMRIRAGVPVFPQDIEPGSLNPIEANLAGAVSFDKGCYLGQEVVARVHRMQRLTRRLVRLSGIGHPPEPPHELVDGETPVGRMTSVVKNHDTYTGLGVLKSRYADGRHAFGDLILDVETLPPS